MAVTLGHQYNVGERPAVKLYNCIINRHTGTPNKTTIKDMISLDCSSICYIVSRIGWVSMKEIYKLYVYIYVDVILESCPITIPLVYSKYLQAAIMVL